MVTIKSTAFDLDIVVVKLSVTDAMPLVCAQETALSVKFLKLVVSHILLGPSEHKPIFVD